MVSRLHKLLFFISLTLINASIFPLTTKKNDITKTVTAHKTTYFGNLSGNDYVCTKRHQSTVYKCLQNNQEVDYTNSVLMFEKLQSLYNSDPYASYRGNKPPRKKQRLNEEEYD